MNRDKAYAEHILMKKTWEVALSVVDKRGKVEGDLSKVKKSFLRRKACSGFDAQHCEESLDHAIAIAQEMRRYQFSSMGSNMPDSITKYKHLSTMAQRLQDALPTAPDVLIDFACGTIQYEWMR